MSTETIRLRFAVTGGRDYTDWATCLRTLLERGNPRATLVHGDARGADQICATIWDALGRATEPHPADWAVFGKSAGHRRNAEMVGSGIDYCIAFPGGAGTAGMVRACRAADVPVIFAASVSGEEQQ